MAVRLKIRVTNSRDRVSFEREFSHFPVRIGRHTLNELCLDFPFISQFHATLEFDGPRLFVRDLGSKNGTMVRSTGKLPTNSRVELSDHKYEFAIVSLLFQVTVETLQMDDDLPTAPEFGRSFGDAGADMETSKTTRAPLSASELTPSPSSPQRSRTSGNRPSVSVHEAAAALDGLRSIAGTYLPGGGSLTTEADVLAFVHRLRSTLDVFFRCFPAMRDTFKVEEAPFGPAPSRKNEDLRKSGPSASSATSAEELGQALLDWTNDDTEAHRVVESAFAELIVNQVALLNGVMVGARELVGTMAPAAVAASLDEPGDARSGKAPVTLERYRQLWEAYARRHSDVDDDDDTSFARRFGPQFAQSFARLGAEALGTRTAPTPSDSRPGGPKLASSGHTGTRPAPRIRPLSAPASAPPAGKSPSKRPR
ncbi:MAG: FHA domain-containing protein [Polyangiaceae bacterium]